MALKHLHLQGKMNRPESVIIATGLLGQCYYYLGENNTSLRYNLGALKLAEALHNDQIYFGWASLAQVYQSLNQPDSAIRYAKNAYDTMKAWKHSEGWKYIEGWVSNILGDAYAGKSNYDSALSYYRIGMSSAQKNDIGIDLVDSYNGIASVYTAKNNFDSAAWYSKKALAQKIEKRYPIGLLKAANMLADIYELQNKPDSTLKYLRIALNVKDSLFSRERTMAIQNLAVKEQEKQKEVEAAKLQSQNQLKMYSLLGGLFTVLAIAGLLFRNNRQKQKANTKIEKAYEELKSTQAQLIQSEKMASLGELTAGIAHEIQNPLNFVNNFSEVNKELLVEMNEEIEKGNFDEVKAIAKDVTDNQEKINHHGKRADAIVKGMLQHSRASTGKKEPTDINALADEYLRLSYHGMRAKDKSFNATLKTDFDNNIEKINIVPQDIGRVLLNLFNNAFYAVPPAPLKGEHYEPTVQVSTKKNGDKVLISVKDNGIGIPQNIVDKIFHPFFTTKPTGKGTGLGLSLSYDIVKAQGGEIKVESKEGEGSEFIIQVPNG